MNSKLAFIGAMTLPLASCGQPGSAQPVMVDGLYKAEISAMADRIKILEETVREQNARIDGQDKIIKAVIDDAESLAKTVSHNAKVSNDNSARDMTRRGVCGRVWEQSSDGQWFQVNKTCNAKDLR